MKNKLFIHFLIIVVLITSLPACSTLMPQPTATPTVTPLPPTATPEPPTPTPMPTDTPAPTPEPLPTEPPSLTSKHYVVSLANLMNRPCDLVTEDGALVMKNGCHFGPTDIYAIPLKGEVYFAIFVPEEPGTMDNATTGEWVKLKAGDYVKNIDGRGQMFSCSPPGHGEFVCVVYILEGEKQIPVKIKFRSALS
jgi:hypothetical protein